MLKTLRITSFLLVAVSVCGAVLLVLWASRGDDDMEAFLARDGVVQRLKGQVGAETEEKDMISPLVNQAKQFALRIDPPPPPRPDPPPRQQTQRQEPPPRPEPRPEPQPVRPPRPVTVRFELLATAQSEHNPQRSFALIKPAVGSAKWYGTGERIEHLEVHQINAGSVVLYQDGSEHSEIFVPSPEPRVRSLLKADAEPSEPAGPSSVVAEAEDVPAAEGRRPEAEAGQTEQAAADAPRTVTRSRPTVDPQARVRRTPPPVRQPSPEEQKESLAQSIASIEDIRTREDPHLDDQQRQKEQEAWGQLLELLQKEQEMLESGRRAPGESDDASRDDNEQEPDDGDGQAASENDQ